MNKIFTEEELKLLSVNFILSIPDSEEIPSDVVFHMGNNKSEVVRSDIHQNKKRRVFGGFYKAITRIIE